MALPIDSKKKKRGVARRVKLPINMQSKYQPKCPNCSAPYVRQCINCGFKNENSKEAKERKPEFTKGSRIK